MVKRLQTVARAVSEKPQASLPEACRGLAKTRGAYRLFAHPEVTLEKV